MKGTMDSGHLAKISLTRQASLQIFEVPPE
ncbi:hypothetical protein Gorai_019243, partial [Gossypium raimondii]|nr:hypothetical protein [Gossypium raimondii]